MKNRKILLCVILLCIIFLLAIFSVKLSLVDFKKIKTGIFPDVDNIIFLEPSQAYSKIEETGYINTFNKIDLKVRNTNSIEDCKEIYKKNVLSFSAKEKNILIDLIKKINKKIKVLKNFYKITWKFARVSNKIDNGLPHTHMDTIYLSDKFFNNPNMGVLIHEKIHIYQKMYPDKSEKLYKIYNYEKTNKIESERRRANPDLNNFDYKKNGKVIYSEYKENASSLTDIKLVTTNENSVNISGNPSHDEHPDEYFAYLLTNKILNGFNKDDNELINYLTN